jgi:antitoxin component YwqK of YwqJK toxin-antitoxin module
MTGESKDGPFRRYHDNGQLWWKGTYKDGVEEGPIETYHENGQLKSKGTLRDGKGEGLIEYYHDNGQLGTKGTYNMGEKCGEWFEGGETKTYPPCPPDLEGEN